MSGLDGSPYSTSLVRILCFVLVLDTVAALGMGEWGHSECILKRFCTNNLSLNIREIWPLSKKMAAQFYIFSPEIGWALTRGIH